MDWSQLLDYSITVLVTLVLSAIVVGVKMGLKWLIAHNNTMLKTFAELAYNEIEMQFSGTAGAQKLQLAIESLKRRLSETNRLKNISNDRLTDAIQKAWFQNEGQYKPALAAKATATQKAAP